MRTMSPAAFVLFSLFVSACSTADAAGDPVSRASAPMIAGSRDTTHSAVVRIFNFRSDGSGTTCSGTVVTPHIVLTAAHCVFPAVVGPVKNTYVFNGENATSSEPTSDKSKWILAKEVRFHPKYGGAQVKGNDIGVVITQDTLPVPPMKVALRPLQLADVQGQAMVGVGYGWTKAGEPQSAGIRTRRDVTVVGLRDPDLFSVTEGTMCHGDSGGPLIWPVQGVDTIIGVHAFVSSEACATGNFSTRVDMFAEDYLRPIAEEIDPGYLVKAPAPSVDAGTQDATPTTAETKDAGAVDAAPGLATNGAEDAGGCSVGEPRARTSGRASYVAVAIAFVAFYGRRRARRELNMLAA